MFLRKACRGILPTRQNLSRRLKMITPDCLRCRCSLETDKHILFDCQEAKEVWKELQDIRIPSRKNYISFKDWFAESLHKHDRLETELISIIIWLLWKSRNESLFEGVARGKNHICNYAYAPLQEFQASQDKRMVSLSYQNSLQPGRKWKPPSQGFLKINVDAAYSNEGNVGIGIIVRDHNGEIQAVMIEHIPHCLDAEHAETIGILIALQFAADVGISHGELEGDARCVINKINNQKDDLSSTGHLIEDIRSWRKTFPALSINHVSRLKNKAAHETSKLALLVKNYCLWFSNFPRVVLLAANSDSS